MMNNPTNTIAGTVGPYLGIDADFVADLVVKDLRVDGFEIVRVNDPAVQIVGGSA
jgi:hypothetical protein